MKLFLILLLSINSLIFAAESQNSSDERMNENIKKQLEREKLYSKEQTFYKGKNYNLKDSEVDENSVKNLPEQSNRNENFDMDAVYD